MSTALATALGPDAARLPPTLRRAHATPGRHRFTGLAQVERRKGPLPWLLCALLRLPEPGRDVPVTLVFDNGAGSDHWDRRFARRRYHSRFKAGDGRDAGLLVEHMGPLRFRFRPRLDGDGMLHLTLESMSVLGLPLPRPLVPHCPAREWQDHEGRFRFDIPVTLPGLGFVIRYGGVLEPV
ncbi:DUF4166 domain-containing protein [Aerophototrophica crusticola]|uniref:DUF4166 domain-containing protein n=1 Tax=Aerophototrophica crusticola TaxID=1709002 RepID=A0A858R9L7_9PROT|nr:DUF4166 domain-containing protein [Rhodospirillaceae bacterium B3]